MQFDALWPTTSLMIVCLCTRGTAELGNHIIELFAIWTIFTYLGRGRILDYVTSIWPNDSCIPELMVLMVGAGGFGGGVVASRDQVY
jgi:hypothetical protein